MSPGRRAAGAVRRPRERLVPGTARGSVNAVADIARRTASAACTSGWPPPRPTCGPSSPAPAGPTTAPPAAWTCAATARCWSSRHGCAPRSSTVTDAAASAGDPRPGAADRALGGRRDRRLRPVVRGPRGRRRPVGGPDLRAVGAGVHRRFAVRPGRGAGWRRLRRVRDGVGRAARCPQRGLRRAAGRAAAAHGLRRLVGAQLVIDESTAVALGAETAASGPAGSGSGPPAWRCSCCGTSPPWSAPWPAAASATRATWAWTPRRRPPSSRCCAPRLRDRPTWLTALVAALVAVAVVPVVPAGVPVLVAALVPVVAVVARRRSA